MGQRLSTDGHEALPHTLGQRQTWGGPGCSLCGAWCGWGAWAKDRSVCGAAEGKVFRAGARPDTESRAVIFREFNGCWGTWKGRCREGGACPQPSTHPEWPGWGHRGGRGSGRVGPVTRPPAVVGNQGGGCGHRRGGRPFQSHSLTRRSTRGGYPPKTGCEREVLSPGPKGSLWRPGPLLCLSWGLSRGL